MKSRTLKCITTMTLFATLAIPVRLASQQQQPRYKLVDLGTFGGPNSYGSAGGAGTQILNNQGTVTGSADTSTPDPYAPNCANPDCFVSHAFRWQNGVLTDLGALPGVNSAFVSGINERGWIVGGSENGVIDPLTGGPESRAVLWADGRIIDLGTLGGNESVAIAVNNRGQVTGFATNATPDPFSGFGTQVRAFLWENGVMQDLGTLGGPDSPPLANTPINERGQIAGSSNTNSTPNPLTGIPTTHPFLWEKGTLTDLGTLGGTEPSFPESGPVSMNNRGQVAGTSYLAGNLSHHPSLWDRGSLIDLGTLGGSCGGATWINNGGDIVGGADVSGACDQTNHAFLWKSGVMTDLGTLNGDDCSIAFAVNSKDQVVGGSVPCVGGTARAFLWEHGGPMLDLNTLIPPNSGVQLGAAQNINDRGEIGWVGGVLANGDMHAFLLIPCGEGDEGCGDAGPTTVAAIQSSPAPFAARPPTTTPLFGRGMLNQLRARRFPGRRTLGPASAQQSH